MCFEKYTGQSRGFGFVTFVNKEDYERCLENPIIEGDGFTLTIAKVGKPSDSRSRKSGPYHLNAILSSDDYSHYHSEKRGRYESRDHYGYNKDRQNNDYRGNYDMRGQYYQDQHYPPYGYAAPPSDYRGGAQPYYPSYPAQSYQQGDYSASAPYRQYDYENAHPSASQGNSRQQPADPYDSYGYPPNYCIVCL